jgi:hypothetical protein
MMATGLNRLQATSVLLVLLGQLVHKEKLPLLLALAVQLVQLVQLAHKETQAQQAHKVYM